MGQVMHIKAGDLFPSVETTVTNESGAVVDLTGATCKFSMRKSRDPVNVPISLANGQLVNGPGGKLGYNWQAGQTNDAGTYEAEFLVDPAVGADFRVPTQGYITIIIEPKVA